mmetsp:Transcript_30060/g.39561  ORF Transcript_30060/g.39561 Transcript_30060/m.39561 type:complete len:423 (+) Transcript_30060:122-1390(+)
MLSAMLLNTKIIKTMFSKRRLRSFIFLMISMLFYVGRISSLVSLRGSLPSLSSYPNSWKISLRSFHSNDASFKQYRTVFKSKRCTLVFSSPKDDFIVRRSDVEEFEVRGREVLVKRDDQLRLDSGISGNKARKMFWLNQIPTDKFPKNVISHGGHQSNALVSLAAICSKNRPNTQLHYYTKKIPRWLRNNPSGNFARALALGTQMIELSNEDYETAFGGPAGKLEIPSCLDISMENALYIPQGGAVPLAEVGVEILAREILEYVKNKSLDPEKIVVVTPSGTGTTSLFLAKHLHPEGVQVVTVPCIGDGEYLFRQMSNLQRAATHSTVGEYPHILDGTTKYQFGKPDQEILDIWREFEDIGLYVDLVYAPRAWQVLFENWEPKNPVLGGKKILYVHSGGIEGVSTQLTRYKHHGLIEPKQTM